MMNKKFFGLSLAVLILMTALDAGAVEQKKYKTVTPEEPGSELWKGPAPRQTNNAFFGFGLNFFDSFGLQGRYALRVIDGIIPEITNPVYLEAGLALTFYGKVRGNDVVGIALLPTGRWDFQYNNDWTFFGTLGFGYNAVTSGSTDDVKGGGLFPAIGGGAMYNISSDWAARADLSYQFFGVGLQNRF